ncbi:hypothetical protein MNBD_IGNAVI01-3062 [hydrothermal vent metagenome]|uniref:Choloylglycine hydrolase/NAAA C-terminal domain-containing protein n=1 Tax=hydrothermal vent metagenome TaxID=652676 RepID=A0A3B1CCB9_9ZZZZ
MKRLSITLLLICAMFDSYNACTTFVIKDSTHLLFCRNYDYDFGAGFIVINKRNVAKRSLVFQPYEPLKWVSKYGSITFNQVGVDAPMGGMNEKGLVISLMALPESKYPEYKGGAALNQMEWIQYQLDNSASLKEVIANAKKLQTVPVATPAHYFVCDSLGNIGIFEYLNGELIIYQDAEVTIPVCSNMIYEKSVDAIKDYKGFGGEKSIPAKWRSVADIVAIARSKIDEYKKSNDKDPVDYSFQTLAAVGSPERTQWSVVYDIKEMKIHFKSLHNKNIRTLNFYDFDYDCGNEIQILDIQTSINSTPVKDQFFTLTKEYYTSYKVNLIHWFKMNVKGFPDIPNEAINNEVKYIFKRKCREHVK